MHDEKVRTRILVLTVLTLGGALLSGCLVGEEVEEPGMMAFYVKDQPAALARLDVTFTEVRAVTAADLETPESREANETGDPNETARNTTGPVGSAQFETVGDDPTRVDLLAVRGNETAARIAQGEVDAGSYSHVVIHMEGGEAGFGGTVAAPVEIVREYVVLSGEFDVQEGELTQILVDFDLERSLRVESQNETVTVVFDPVLADVQVAVTPITPAAERDFQFGEAESRETAVILASDVRIERGAVVVAQPVLKQEAEVDVALRVDADGDGTVEQTVRSIGDLRDAIGTPGADRGLRVTETPPTATPSPTGTGIRIPLPSPTSPLGIRNATG